MPPRFSANLHPDIKRKLKSAFHVIAADPYAGKGTHRRNGRVKKLSRQPVRLSIRLKLEQPYEIIAVGPGNVSTRRLSGFVDKNLKSKLDAYLS